MKNITIARAIAAGIIGLASVSAFAANDVVTDANYPGPMSLQSNTTRAQVQADLARAKAAGQVIDGDAYPGVQAIGASTVSREQVRAELIQAKAQGYAFNDATYPVPSRTLPRQPAKAHFANIASAGNATLVMP